MHPKVRLGATFQVPSDPARFLRRSVPIWPPRITVEIRCHGSTSGGITPEGGSSLRGILIGGDLCPWGTPRSCGRNLRGIMARTMSRCGLWPDFERGSCAFGQSRSWHFLPPHHYRGLSASWSESLKAAFSNCGPMNPAHSDIGFGLTFRYPEADSGCA